jgi:hypothetical protein
MKLDLQGGLQRSYVCITMNATGKHNKQRQQTLLNYALS